MSKNWRAKALGSRTAIMANADGILTKLSWTPKITDGGPLAVTPDPVSYEAYSVIDRFKPTDIGTQRDSLIQAGDVKLMLSAFSEPSVTPLPEPPNGALVVAPDGITYKVANVEPINPSGTVLAYIVALRR